MKNSWTWREWAIVACIVLNIGAKMCTVYLTTDAQSLGSAASALESNGSQRVIQSLGYIQFVTQAFLYAVILTAYLWARVRKNVVLLNLSVLIFLIIGIMDFTNDLSYILAVVR